MQAKKSLKNGNLEEEPRAERLFGIKKFQLTNLDKNLIKNYKLMVLKPRWDQMCFKVLIFEQILASFKQVGPNGNEWLQIFDEVKNTKIIAKS